MSCKGLTKKQLPCKNKAGPTGYCYLHLNQSSNVIPKVIISPPKQIVKDIPKVIISPPKQIVKDIPKKVHTKITGERREKLLRLLTQRSLKVEEELIIQPQPELENIDTKLLTLKEL